MSTEVARRLAALTARPIAMLGFLTLGCLLTYLMGTAISSGVGGELVQGDARSYFAYLPSMVLDGDLDLRNQFLVLAPGGRAEPTPWGEGVDGVAANPFPVAPALVWLPGYAVGVGIDWLTDGMGSGKPLGYGPAAVWGAATMSVLAVGLGAWCALGLVRRYNGGDAALVAVGAVWLGTPLLYYTIVTPLYSHGIGWFAAALFLYLLPLRAEARPARWVGAGLAGGFMVANRLQDAPILALALTALFVAWRSDELRPTNIAALAAGGLIGYLPQGLTWYKLYGTLVPIEPHAEVGAFSISKLWSVLASTGYEGWLTWSPVVALCLWGLTRVARRSDREAIPLAIGATVAVLGVIWLDVVHPYGAGSAFGGRRYVSLGPILVLGLAALLADQRGRERQPFQLGSPVVLTATILLTAYSVWLLAAYELLAIRYGIYGTLGEVWSFGLAMSIPS